MLRNLAVFVLAVLALPALGQQPAAIKPKTPPPKLWLEMDRGPVVSATIESAYPQRNITQKGIAIRLDEKSQAYVLFDEDLFRYSIAWTGGFIDFKGVLFDGQHRVWPSVVGQPIFGTSLAPGWGHNGNFDDPRTRYKSTEYTKESEEWKNRPYGPLPHEHAQYKGLYFHGQQVILSYTVGGTAILDSPGLQRAGGVDVITRTLNIAKADADLDLEILEHPSANAKILAGIRPPTAKRQATAQGSVALLGDLAATTPATRPATTSPADGSIAVIAQGASNDMIFSIVGQSHLRLHIPAAATPARLKLLIARVDSTTLKPFIAAADSSPAAVDLSTLTAGGPPRYPQVLETHGTLAPAVEEGPAAPGPAYVVDTLAAPNDNPFKSRMRFGAFDFFPDGKSAAITTWDGDVWRVSNIDEKLDHLTWQRIATGLYQPLGLQIIGDAIYVLCRDQMVRLHDLNGDGEIDFYECFNNDHQVTEHFHEFAMGLQTDPQGNFYYAKSARHALDAVVPQHGTLLKVSRDGTKTEILANGFRAANGIGIGPNGELAATDQEGFWTPANRINLFTPSADGTPFFGNLWSYLGAPRTMKEGFDPPLCWIPVNVDRSPAEDLWVTSDRWGPLKGQLIHTSYGTGKLFLVLHETVDGVPQGGVVPFPDLAFRTGTMRARFNPVDGQLYACGLVGWATNMTEPGGFHRIRYTGKPLRMPTALYVQKDSITLSFSDPLNKAAAEDPASYAVQQWGYRWTQNYGSKHYSVADSKKEGHDDVEVTAATLGEDGRTVTLKIASLQPVMQMKIQVSLKTADGKPLVHTIHNTINRVPAKSN
ncbi:MAG: Cytochrome c [Phycisphaerales bacterium]|nr:Cytochrome c [Phycisphaerales bacterium]